MANHTIPDIEAQVATPNPISLQAIKLGRLFFKFRGITPLPFVLLYALYSSPTGQTFFAGASLMLLGEAIRLWAMSYLGRPARSTEIQASRLVTEGPFRFVRNPIYLANVLIYLGTTIAANLWMPYLLLIVAVYFGIQYNLIVLSEEAALLRLFGEQFTRYRNSVPRFIPRMKPSSLNNPLSPDWKTGMRTERSTFMSLGAILLMFIVRMMI